MLASLGLHASTGAADDPAGGTEDYSVGVLRVQFAPADVQPDFDPLPVLEAAGVKTSGVGHYTEQGNLDGEVQSALLLAQSSPQAVGRWCDVAVPFSTEKFWVQFLSGRSGVTSVRRKSFHGIRSADPQVPSLNVSQQQINTLEAPTLRFLLSGETKTVLDAALAFCRNFYGPDHVKELQLVTGSRPASSPRIFAVEGLRQKFFHSPPWQQMHITAVLTPGEAGRTVLQLVFTGDGAFGMDPPPARKYRSFLLDGAEKANFFDYISHLGTDLRASLLHDGFTFE